jgi:hypothetical protein
MLVFSLNTALGFACSLGFDMGYNKQHHGEETVTTPATSHCHQEKMAVPSSQHHDENKASLDNPQPANTPDDCCSNGVTSFNLLNKTVPQAVSFVHPAFSNAFIPSFYQVSILPQHDTFKNIRSFAQSYHPPIPDICIAVQRFLI